MHNSSPVEEGFDVTVLTQIRLESWARVRPPAGVEAVVVDRVISR